MKIKDIIQIFKMFGFRDGIRCIKYNMMVEKDMKQECTLLITMEELLKYFRDEVK